MIVMIMIMIIVHIITIIIIIIIVIMIKVNNNNNNNINNNDNRNNKNGNNDQSNKSVPELESICILRVSSSLLHQGNEQMLEEELGLGKISKRDVEVFLPHRCIYLINLDHWLRLFCYSRITERNATNQVILEFLKSDTTKVGKQPLDF